MSEMMSKNPIVSNMYTADPAPMVYGNTLYLYTTHDEDELVNNFYTIYLFNSFFFHSSLIFLLNLTVLSK